MVEADLRYACIESLIRDVPGDCEMTNRERFNVAKIISVCEEPEYGEETWNVIKERAYTVLGTGIGGVVEALIDEA